MTRPPKAVVGHIDLIHRIVGADLFDAANDHRRGRRIFGDEGGLSQLGLRRGAIAAAGASAAPATSTVCHRNESGYGSRGALTLDPPDSWIVVKRLSVGSVRDVWDRRQHLAGFRIVFADRVLPDVDEALFVDRHPVTLRRVERFDHVPGLVEVNHRRRMDAAVRQRRSQFGFDLDARQIVRTVQHPDVVVLVHGQARHAAHLPFGRQRLRPIGIVLEARHAAALGVRPRAGIGNEKCDAGQYSQHSSESQIALPHLTSPRQAGRPALLIFNEPESRAPTIIP